MTFEIRPVDRPTFEAIWTPKVREQLDQIIYRTDHWIDRVTDKNWVIDDSSQTIVMRVAMANRFDAAECYALVTQGEFALIRRVDWATYTIAAYSIGFKGRIEEAQALATSALLLGGRLLDGNPGAEGSDFLRSIPYVTFVEYIAPKIGE